MMALLYFFWSFVAAIKAISLADKPFRYWSFKRMWIATVWSLITLMSLFMGVAELFSFTWKDILIHFSIATAMLLMATVPCGMKFINKSKVLFILRTLAILGLAALHFYLFYTKVAM